MEDRRIPFNPCRGVRVHTSGRPERPHASTEQVAAIAARMRRPVDALMVVTAAYTGMRWGELSGLDRANVDLEHGSIHVHPDVGAPREIGGHLFLRPHATLPPWKACRVGLSPRSPVACQSAATDAPTEARVIVTEQIFRADRIGALTSAVAAANGNVDVASSVGDRGLVAVFTATPGARTRWTG